MKNLLVSIALLTSILFLGCSDNFDDPAECMPDPTLEGESSFVTKIADDHHTAYTDVVIDASAAEVWGVLTDWDNMSSWSTSFQGLSGDIRDGGQVAAIYLNEGQIVEVPHTLIYEEGMLFGWSDPTGTPDMEPFGGFVDEHIFEVQEISSCQSRFIQRDSFKGPGNATFNSEGLANFAVGLYRPFNAELKAEVERR